MNQQEQLNIEDKELDTAATLHNARQALRKYRRFLLQVDDEYLPKITPSYSLEPKGGPTEYNGSTERVIGHIDRREERESYMNAIMAGVNRLNATDRKIIVMQYMGREELYNVEMQRHLSWGEQHYIRKKKQALINFAIALEVEVEK